MFRSHHGIFDKPEKREKSLAQSGTFISIPTVTEAKLAEIYERLQGKDLLFCSLSLEHHDR